MPEYRYILVVETDTEEHADQVLTERIGYDEELWDEQNTYIVYKIWDEGRVR